MINELKKQNKKETKRQHESPGNECVRMLVVRKMSRGDTIESAESPVARKASRKFDDVRFGSRVARRLIAVLLAIIEPGIA